MRCGAAGAVVCVRSHAAASLSGEHPIAHRIIILTSLFCLDVGRLDDGPPLLDLGLLVRVKRGWCLLVPRWEFLAEVFRRFPHVWIGERIYDRII